MKERRVKDRCPDCNGEKFNWLDGSILRRHCQICGKEFDCKRETDLHKFKEEVKLWQ